MDRRLTFSDRVWDGMRGSKGLHWIIILIKKSIVKHSISWPSSPAIKFRAVEEVVFFFLCSGLCSPSGLHFLCRWREVEVVPERNQNLFFKIQKEVIYIIIIIFWLISIIQ